MRIGPRQLAVVAMAAAAWFVATRWDLVVHRHISDLPVYREVATQLGDGRVPYRDFDIEYPPGAVLVVAIARLLPTSFATGFSLLMLACLIATALGVMATAQRLGFDPRRELAAGSVVALTPLLLGDFVATRFDLAVAAVVAWMVALAAGRHFRWAWVLLGLAVLIKLFPVVLAPALLLWQRRSGDGRPWRDSLFGAAVVAVGTAPFLLVGAQGLWNMLHYHLARPLQIESTGASYLLGLSALSDRGRRVSTSYGSQNLVGTGPDVITAISTGLQLALVATVAVVLARRLREADTAGAPRVFVAAVATTLAGMLATGKVLSPQFLVWLLPACLLVAGRYRLHAMVATASAMVVTQLYFPYRYWELVALQDRPVALLAIRNALLIVLVAACWPRRNQSQGILKERIEVARPSAPASITAP